MNAVTACLRGFSHAGMTTLATLLLIAVIPARSFGHDIPNDITIHAYVKPEGRTLRLLARAPIIALRDMQLPLFGPGYLNIAKADDELRRAAITWIGHEIALYENGVRLPFPELISVRVSIPSDRSFAAYETALEHVTGPPLPEETQLYWQQAMVDVLFHYPIQSEQSEFSIDPGLEGLGLRVVTALHYLPPGGDERVFQYTGDPGLVRLDPRWHQAAFQFLALGFEHILDGIDHLLFLLCLVIPYRRLNALVALVTAFTVAHSITLIASVYGLTPDALWFPPLVETLIAASIVYMALENIVGASLSRRWALTFGFGLIHGFGFSFALRETLQFAGSHLATSLLMFNAGVEAGQLLVIALLVPALSLLLRIIVNERVGIIILSALVTHTAWHWMTERGDALLQHDFQWPAFDLSLMAGIFGWMALILVFAGLSWRLLRTLLQPGLSKNP